MRAAMTCILVLMLSAELDGQTLTMGAPKTTSASDVAIQVFADGAFRSALGGEGDGKNATAGSIGIGVVSGKWSVSGQIALGTGDDSLLTGGYGASLLYPGSGGFLSAGFVDVRRNDVYKGIGIHGYVSASSARWRTQNPGTPNESIGAAVGGFGLGISYTIFNQQLTGTENTVAFLIDAGIAYRRLFGDIANSESAVEAAKLRTLGTAMENFRGIELGFTIQVNAIRAGLTFYGMEPTGRKSDTDRGDAIGLTDGQVVAGASILAPFLSWKGRQ